MQKVLFRLTLVAQKRRCLNSVLIKYDRAQTKPFLNNKWLQAEMRLFPLENAKMLPRLYWKVSLLLKTICPNFRAKLLLTKLCKTATSGCRPLLKNAFAFEISLAWFGSNGWFLYLFNGII